MMESNHGGWHFDIGCIDANGQVSSTMAACIHRALYQLCGK